jgi:starvation-inducible outer membrane lipoprotein
MRNKALIAAIALGLAGCASFPLTVKDECHHMGYAKGTPEFRDCMGGAAQRQAEADQRANQNTRDLLGAALVVGAVAASTPPARAPAPKSEQGRLISCPDGSYVYGRRCLYAPNGHYVGAP